MTVHKKLIRFKQQKYCMRLKNEAKVIKYEARKVLMGHCQITTETIMYNNLNQYFNSINVKV